MRGLRALGGLDGLAAKGVAHPILSLFADGTDGFYFDFSKTDWLSQLSIGGAPANDPSENIGLALDSHAWRGSNPVVLFSDDFNSYANDTALEAVWTELLGSAAGGSPGISLNGSGGMRVRKGSTTAGTVGGRKTISGLTIGQRYKLSYEITGGTALGYVEVSGGFNDGSGGGGRGVGRWSIVFTATGTSHIITLYVANIVLDTYADFDNVRFEAVPGNHGSQATTAAQPKYQTSGLARFDGTDDNLLTTLNTGEAFTMMAKLYFASAPAGTQVVMGVQDAVGPNRAFLAVDGVSGKLRAGLGTNGTINLGAANAAGAPVVAAFMWDGTNAILYRNGVVDDSDPQGANLAPTTIPIRVGGNNNNGTAANFFGGDIYHALAIKKALTAAQIAAVTNHWGTA